MGMAVHQLLHGKSPMLFRLHMHKRDTAVIFMRDPAGSSYGALQLRWTSRFPLRAEARNGRNPKTRKGGNRASGNEERRPRQLPGPPREATETTVVVEASAEGFGESVDSLTSGVNGSGVCHGGGAHGQKGERGGADLPEGEGGTSGGGRRANKAPGQEDYGMEMATSEKFHTAGQGSSYVGPV
jgi:hypothetical protein